MLGSRPGLSARPPSGRERMPGGAEPAGDLAAPTEPPRVWRLQARNGVRTAAWSRVSALRAVVEAGRLQRMEVRFVGSGDAFGTGGRFQTCIRVQASGVTALVDCGTTTLTAMKAQLLDPGEVGAVVITHLHGDHFGGLPFLILDGQFTRRTTPLTVLGPNGTARRLHTAMEALYPGSTTVQRRFELHVLELPEAGATLQAGPLSVTGWHVDHPSGAPALALRVDLDGNTCGYSGDTAWTPALIAAAAGTDLFACEAYTYNHPVRHHLDYADIHQNAAELDTSHLILTHLGPTMLQHARDSEHAVASDGLTIQV
jgi:ribonuclease BN (tRNA processing enzyme)